MQGRLVRHSATTANCRSGRAPERPIRSRCGPGRRLAREISTAGGARLAGVVFRSSGVHTGSGNFCDKLKNRPEGAPPPLDSPKR